MVKKIHLNFDNITKEEYKEWTHEAVGEFLDLFPDYKDLFEITEEPIEKDKSVLAKNYTRQELDKLINIVLENFGNSGYTKEQFENIFAQQPDGTYKYHPTGDYKATRGALFVLEEVNNGNPVGYTFPIEISFSNEAHDGSLGEGGQMSGAHLFLETFERTTQGKDEAYKKAFFKMLLTHEIGHAFKACEKGTRQLDTSEVGLGHCLNDDCIMRSGDNVTEAFNRLYPNSVPAFCNDCKKDIERYMRMIKDPNQHEFTNDTRSTDPVGGQDYDEPDNPNMPELVRILKAAYKDHDIAMRATKEKQEDYPYSYNLYKRGEKPADGATPTGRITITNEKNITIKSKDINHFVVAMNAIKQKGGSEIRLNLSDNATDESRKAFAAHAVIAGMIAGVEIKNNPYSLDELKEINPMIEKVIKLNKQKEDAKNAATALESNTDTAKEQDLEKTLGTSIDEAFGTYQQLSKDALPNFDSLKKFECGVNAVQKAKTRRVAQQILTQRRNAGHGA